MTGYETSDVPPKFVSWTGIGLAVLTVLVALGAGGLVMLFQARYEPSYRPSAFERAPLTPPAPRLQIDPADDAAAYQTQMDHDLATYGWIDRKAGVVRIPIAEAMRRLAAQGWPHPTADTGVGPSIPPTPRAER